MKIIFGQQIVGLLKMPLPFVKYDYSAYYPELKNNQQSIDNLKQLR